MIARRSFLIILNKALGTVIGFMGIFFVFRYLAKESFGMHAYAYGLLELFAIINGLGINAAHVKRISEGHDEAKANATYLVSKLILLGAFAAITLGAYFIWTGVLGKGFDTTTGAVLGLMFAVYIVLALRMYFDFAFRAHRRVAVGEFVLFIDSVVTSAGYFTISQVWAHRNGHWVPFQDWAEFWAQTLAINGPVGVADGALLMTAAYFLGTFVSFLVALGFFVAHKYPVGRPDRVTLRKYFDFAWPVALVSVMATLYTHMDTVFVGFFWDEVDVADYRSSLKLLVPALVFGKAVYTILFPTISRHHARENLALVVSQVRLAERYLSMVLLGVITLAVVFTEQAFNIAASSAYISASTTLRLLLIYVFFQTIIIPSKSILMGIGRPLLMARVGFLTTLLAVVLNFLLVPPDGALGIVPTLGLGAPGAALGTGIALAFAYAYVKSLARRETQVPWIPPGILRQLIAAALTASILWWAKYDLGTEYFDRYYELAAAGVAGLAIYGLLLLLVGELTRRDWVFLQDLMHPGKMGTYMRDELRGRHKDEE